jgi:hypothetical protein
MKSKNRQNRQSTASNVATATRSSNPVADQVSMKAYEIYQQEGRPEGRALDHWLEAEAGVAVQTNAIH